MGPKKVKSASDKVGKKPKSITIQTKKEIIEKHDSGVRVSDLNRQFSMAKSTICRLPS